MEINPADIPASALNKIILGSVVPRPIAWVSTVNEEGWANLAPFSFFNAVCYRPPTLLFCPGIRASDGGVKDTYMNIKATKEFIINVVTEDNARAMVLSSTELPSDVNEFEFAGLTPVLPSIVSAPRVAESPINFECKLDRIIEIGDGRPGSGWIVIGEVVHIHISDSVLLPDYKIDIKALKPVGRLSGANYTYVRDIFEMKRQPSQIPAKP
ncbi:MAG: flavin reductase family protein [Anaerolineales bacterium]